MTDRVSPSGPKSQQKTQVSLTHGANIAGSVTTEVTVSAPGVLANDFVYVSPTAALATSVALSHARVTTPDVITIGLANLSTATVAPGTVTYEVFAARR